MYETRGDLSFSYDYDAYGQLSCIRYMWADGSTWKFYAACNSRGDVTTIYAGDGTLRAKYTYDSWGNTLSIIDRYGNDIVALGDESIAADNIGALNRIRYRGYYYDFESGLYYLQSRYYDPQVKRFISPDSTSVVTATPASLNDKNLFAYCDNNPVNRVDVGGQFWDTVFDVISLAVSVVDVIQNPDDVGAWAGLAGDALDLIPFVTGVGEITRAVNTTLDVIEAADTFHDTAKVTGNIVEATTNAGEVVSKNVNDIVEKVEETAETIEELRANQRALSQLGKEIERNAKDGIFISFEEAKIFDEWCVQYNIPQHHPAELESGEHWVTGWDHTHFYGRHIPFKK